MDKKYVLVFALILLVLLAAFGSFFNSSKPKRTGIAVASAVPVLDLNTVPDTEEEVKHAFLQNYEEIINNAKKYCTIRNVTLLPEYLEIEKRS